MFPQVQSLLSLPIGTLAVLGGGYIAYRLAYTGRKSSHSQVDTIMLTLAFGMLVKLVAVAFGTTNFAYFVGVVLTVASAVIWRIKGQAFVRKWLRKLKISDHDGEPSAWASMIARSDLKGPNLLVVYLNDGSAMMCSNLRDFNDAPMGPCLFGEDGSISLYVTDYCTADKKTWKSAAAKLDGGDYLMTVIPEKQIKYVEVQRPGGTSIVAKPTS